MLCFHSSNEEWPLLNQIAAAVQSAEDAVSDATTTEGALLHRAISYRTGTTADSVKKFWTSARSLAKCLELQFEHQSAYQLFYQTLKDYEGALETSFLTIRERLQLLDTAGSKEGAKEILEYTQRLITNVLLWWRRTDSLVTQSRRVLPMRARLEPTDFKRPGHLLVDYSAPEVSLKANDEIFVIDSTNRDQWIVETTAGDRVAIPSLCLAMSGPDPGAIERALALRLQLLANWTIALKELGKSLISFLLSIFRKLNNSQNDSLEEAGTDGASLQPLLGTMEQLLQSYWSDHPDFEELRERMRKARVSLAVYGAEDHIDDCTHIDINTIFLRMSPLVMRSSDTADARSDDAELMKQILGLLIRKYQELAKYWEAYKLMTEASTDPNYFWMVEEFQQLRRVNLSDLLEYMTQEDKESWVDVLQLLAASKAKEAGAPKLPAATETPVAAFKTKITIDILESAQRANGRGDSGCTDSGVGMAGSCLSSSIIDPSRPEYGGDSAPEGGGAAPQPRVKVRDRVAAYEDRVAAAAAVASSDDVFIDEYSSQVCRPSRSTVNRRGSATSSIWSSRCSFRSSATTVGRSTEIEDYKREEIEQKAKLVISCVVDTLDKTVLSLGEAVRKGIINWRTGSYLNRETNQWIPIQTALANGLIIAESRTDGRTKVKKRRVYGMVTMRGVGGGSRQQQPSSAQVIVTAVRDLAKGIQLETATAQAQGLANQSLTKFLDTRSNEWIDTNEACSREVIEFDLPTDPDEAPSPQQTAESFMVYSALDVANGEALSFQQAKERGVIDPDEGVFWNSETGEALELDVAIRKGYVRANRVAAYGSSAAPAHA